MARPEWRDLGKERFWRRQVNRWQASGQTIRDWCRREGLAEHNFHAWRRTLAERDRERTTARRPSAAFVSVEVVDGTAQPIEIVLAGGVLVRVPQGAEEKTLRHVLTILAASSAASFRDAASAIQAGPSSRPEARPC